MEELLSDAGLTQFEKFKRGLEHYTAKALSHDDCAAVLKAHGYSQHDIESILASNRRVLKPGEEFVEISVHDGMVEMAIRPSAESLFKICLDKETA